MNRLVRNTVVRFVIAATLFLAWTGSDTVDADMVSQRTALPLGGTVVFGDSTSSRLFGTWDTPNTADLWALRHPAWYIDAVGGSPVTTLTARAASYLANVNSEPAVVVIALGTNPPNPGGTWWKWNYEQVIESFPASTKFVLVVPIRLNRQTQDMRDKADDVARYARYMNEIAAERADTVLAAWRNTVLTEGTHDPVTGVGDLLHDGIHQKNPFGRDRWMDVLDDAVSRL